MNRKKISIIFMICIIAVCITFIARRRSLLSENNNPIKIKYETLDDLNNYYLSDMAKLENSMEILSLMKNQKGWFIDEGASDFFLGQTNFNQNDGVLTIYREGESFSIYSSGVIWSINENKYIYLNLFNNKHTVINLYNELYDLIGINS